MAHNNAHILQQFDKRPSLVAPQYVETLQLFGLSQPRSQSVEDIIPYDEMCASSMGLGVSNRDKPFVFSGGIAVIPIYGVLLHRDSYASEWATGYDYIRGRVNAAVADPDVQGIVFDVHCYGGQATGCFELSDAIYEARQQKPSIALVDGVSFSGGYALASAAGRIVTTPSSQVGSVGVVMMHTSYEGMLTEMGIKTTFVYAGKHKIDGNAYTDLPEKVRKEYQAHVDKYYDQFVSLVARNRGLDAEVVSGTEARCFDADEALSLGLIDAIQSPSEALVAFRQELEGFDTTVNTGVTHMSNTNTPAAGGDNTTVAAPTANAATAPADTAVTAETAAAATANLDVRQQERERVKAITTSAEASGREALASHLACNTDMSVEQAIATLSASPIAAAAVAPAAAGATPFAAAMDATANPNVGAGGSEDDGLEVATQPVGLQIAESWAKTTGNSLRKSN